MTIPDHELLDRFRRTGDQASFTELVQRHLGMVHSAACRITCQSSLAQEVSQIVFLKLSQLGSPMKTGLSLVTWLHRTTRSTAIDLMRAETRRKNREQTAASLAMNQTSIPWERIEPFLDEIIDKLSPEEHHVVLCRYFEDQSLVELAGSLGLSEDAVRMRINRSLERIRVLLQKRGITTTASALALMLPAQAIASVPAGLASSITTSAAASFTPATSLVKTGLIAMANKNAVTSALLLAGPGIAGMGLSLLAGVALSYGWEKLKSHELVTGPGVLEAEIETIKQQVGREEASPGARTFGLSRELSLDSVRKSFDRYDGLTEPDLLAETRLRCLMFALPMERLDDVLRMLLEMKNPDKFQELACALFSRWTELDPLVALNAAEGAGLFASQARRGVVTTWLNTDPDAALDHIITHPTSEDLGFIVEFLGYKGVMKPEDAARLVDKISEKWPEADSQLFAPVARQWAKSEPERAAKWVASYDNPSVTRPLLMQMVVDVSRTSGRPGLEISNLITDPKVKQQARTEVMENWGRLYGGFSLSPTARPDRNIAEGLPADWTSEDIKTFSRAFVDNFANQLPDLLKIARDDAERTLICESAIKGVQNIDPSKVSFAVESLPDNFVDGPEGRKSLETFIGQWNKFDAVAARAWLETQPAGPKKSVMESEITSKGGTP